MVDNLQRKKHQERDRTQSDAMQDQEPSMTNLARYKQKLREHNRNVGGGAGPKATVQETVNRLQEQSRLIGGTYGTNQFSSLTHTDKEKQTFDDDSD